MPDEAPDEVTDAQPPAAPARRRLRAEALALAELAAVCGVALAQPLLDVVGSSPDFFLFHGARRVEIALLVTAYVLVPPLALWGLGLLVGLAGPRARSAAHLATLGALVSLLAVQVGKQALPVRGVPLAVLAVLAGAGIALCYRRWDAVKQLVRLAAVGPLIFILLFVFASPASAVVLPGERPETRSGGSVGPHPPIVMIVLDELPLLSLVDSAGRIDARNYPNFAALAGQSTWYRNATAVSGFTPHALPAMLTGRYPARDDAPHYARYPDNLFTLLDGAYHLRVQESITQLCPARTCPRDGEGRGGLPTMLSESATLLGEIVSPTETRRDPTAGFSEPTVADGGFAPNDTKFRWDSLDDNQPVRFREFVTGLRPSGRPTAHVLHLLMPHTPWRYLPGGQRYEAPEDLPTGGDPWWPALAHERHLLQLRYTDTLIGETLRALKDGGLYDDALLVVTADHGVSFARDSIGRGMGHVRGSPAEVLWVPTFVKAPGQRRGAVDDRNWQHVDLLPTIADHAGLDVPWPVDGVSGRAKPRATAEKLFFDRPGRPYRVDGPAGLAVVTGAAGRRVPDPPAAPHPDLVGRRVAEFAVRDGGPRATVANADEFAARRPAGALPALVYGTLPDAASAGAPLAIAVNGRIGAVVPVLPRRDDEPRFAGVLPDPSLFTAGPDRLELFLVSDADTDTDTGAGATLTRVPVT